MASDDEYEAEALADPPQIDLLAQLKSRATEMRAARPLHGCVDGDGNCIPAALWRLAAGNVEVPDIGQPISITENIRVRAYKHMEGPFGVTMLYQSRASLVPGQYLIHVEDAGRPHCVAFVIEERC